MQAVCTVYRNFDHKACHVTIGKRAETTTSYIFGDFCVKWQLTIKPFVTLYVIERWAFEK